MKTIDEKNVNDIIFNFCAWLLTDNENITIGQSGNCKYIPDLIDKYCKIHSLDTIAEEKNENPLEIRYDCYDNHSPGTPPKMESRGSLDDHSYDQLTLNTLQYDVEE